MADYLKVGLRGTCQQDLSRSRFMASVARAAVEKKASKFPKVAMKMSDLNVKKKKKKNKGYDLFGEDEKNKKERSSGRFWRPRDEDGESVLMKCLRHYCCCGCLCPRPQHPLLSSTVTHRKISRVTSMESLSKESSGVLERPDSSHHHQPTMDRQPPVRAQHRPQSAPSPEGSISNRETEISKPVWPALPPVPAQRSTRPNHHHALVSTSHPNQRSLMSKATSASLTSLPELPLAASSPKIDRRLPATPGGSPRPEPRARRHRPSQLSLSSISSSASTTTPTDASPVSSPSTPRSRAKTWAVVKGFTHLMLKATTPTSSHPSAIRSSSGEGGDERASDEDEVGEEAPEATCIRPATGGLHNPARECYGAVTLRILGKQGRWVRVVVCGLSGLPWVGGSGGLMLEISIEPKGRPRWLVLPHAHGPNVNVKLEAVVKIPREAKSKRRGTVKVSVWVCGRVWRHAALGHALTPLPPMTDPSPPVTEPLLHHTELRGEVGLVEVGLRCDYADSLVVDSSNDDVTLTVEVLRAKSLRHFHPRGPCKVAPSKLKEHVEIMCRVGLWVKGERVARESSSPVKLPVTNDPVIRTRSVFNLPRDRLQHAAIIVKVLYTSKWVGEDTVGRVQLGPLLYLGTSPEQQLQQAPSYDYNTSITLSHWGQALKTSGQIVMWHHLQL